MSFIFFGNPFHWLSKGVETFVANVSSCQVPIAVVYVRVILPNRTVTHSVVYIGVILSNTTVTHSVVQFHYCFYDTKSM